MNRWIFEQIKSNQFYFLFLNFCFVFVFNCLVKGVTIPDQLPDQFSPNSPNSSNEVQSHTPQKETQFRTIFRTLFRTVSQTGLAEFPDAFSDAFPDFPSLTLGSSSATHVAAVFHMLLFPHINAFLDAILVHFLGHFSGPFSRLFLSHSRFITCHICCCSLSYVAIPSYVICSTPYHTHNQNHNPTLSVTQS